MTLVYENIGEEEILFLRAQDFKFIETKSEYERQRLQKDGLVCVWYTSGKLVIQGKNEKLEKIANILKQREILPKQEKKKDLKKECYNFNSKKHIGSDETLKGDTFGGLVVCAFLYDPEIEDELLSLGVKDSKQIKDTRIIEIAETLLGQYNSRIKIIEMEPKEYNDKNSFHSVTAMLNNAHKDLASQLGSEFHIVDKYPGCTSGNEQITKAEEYSLAVAAASIIARYVGLKQFERLSEKAGFILPKGSSHVSAALEKLVSLKLDFSQFVKINFQNVQRILEN